MQFSAIVNRLIVKNYAFANDLKRKYFFTKNVHSCRLSVFKTRLFYFQILLNAYKICVIRVNYAVNYLSKVMLVLQPS